jgi:hypothetical protein
LKVGLPWQIDGSAMMCLWRVMRIGCVRNDEGYSSTGRDGATAKRKEMQAARILKEE